MIAVIKSSSELRKDYNNNQEEDLLTAERLLSAERARLQGIKGYSADEFEQNMKRAIQRGASRG
ncbi:MAG: hypothetical protein FWG87_03195 [Defluviitaleaceae bacterium]|nr:hypothetical protein [Defluviitaleaceae bacterium]